MKRHKATRIIAALAALTTTLTATLPGSAQQGGGGTIYFINGAGGGFNTNYVWSMNSDGSNVTQLLPWGLFNVPSRALHNGLRWYLTTLNVPNEYYPDGITQRVEIFAIRGDYDPVLNNTSESRVQLTDNPNLQPGFGWWQGTHWGPGDARVSFKARRWDGNLLVEGGIYVADLVYRADGNVLGLAAQPAAPSLAFSIDSSGWPAYGTHTWDNTGAKMAYTEVPANGLWVATLSTGARTRIYSGGCAYPDWSPDGSKIAFTNGASIATIKTNGTGLKTIIRPAYVNNVYVSGYTRAYFSPSGSYITCVGITHPAGGGTDNDVFRATSTGGALTNLTRTPSLVEGPIAWR
jgi:Tol biopolymer transport system component